MAVYPGMKPTLDFTHVPSQGEQRPRRRQRKAVKTPKNPRVKTVCLNQGERGAELSMKWVSPHFSDDSQSQSHQLVPDSMQPGGRRRGRRRKDASARPFEIKPLFPKATKSREKAQPKAISSAGQGKRTVGIKARSQRCMLRQPLQEVDENSFDDVSCDDLDFEPGFICGQISPPSVVPSLVSQTFSRKKVLICKTDPQLLASPQESLTDETKQRPREEPGKKLPTDRNTSQPSRHQPPSELVEEPLANKKPSGNTATERHKQVHAQVQTRASRGDSRRGTTLQAMNESPSAGDLHDLSEKVCGMSLGGCATSTLADASCTKTPVKGHDCSSMFNITTFKPQVASTPYPTKKSILKKRSVLKPRLKGTETAIGTATTHMRSQHTSILPHSTAMSSRHHNSSRIPQNDSTFALHLDVSTTVGGSHDQMTVCKNQTILAAETPPHLWGLPKRPRGMHSASEIYQIEDTLPLS